MRTRYSRPRQPGQGARLPSSQPQPWEAESGGTGACARRGFSSASGSNESRSALLTVPRACSRRKNSTKVKTRQRLIVRVRGTTGMVAGGCAAVSSLAFEIWSLQRELPARGCGDLGHRTTCLRVAAVAVAEHFFRGEPVFEIAAFRPAIFDPEQIGGVLDLGFGGLVRDGGDVSFHGIPDFRVNNPSPKQEFTLRSGCRGLCKSCPHVHAANASDEPEAPCRCSR